MNLVTGNSSFLSKQLIKKFSENDIARTGRVDNLMNGIFYSDEELFESQTEYDKIFHIAAYVPKSSSSNNSLNLFNTNVLMTENIINRLKFNHMIYSSTVSVYEKSDLIYENSSINPNSEYGISKLWGEKIVMKCHKYSILRFSSIYGNGMNETTLIPNYVNQALKDGAITVWGDGSRLQNYIHVSDASELMFKASKSQNTGLFLGTGRISYSNIEVAKLIAEITGAKIKLEGDDNSSSVNYNNLKTQEILEWTPKIELEEGLENYIEWKKRQF